MLARAIEEAGVPTAAIVLIREHARRVKPPRALWVPFPFGFALGRADDAAFQHRVIAAALSLFDAGTVPVLAEFSEETDAPPRLLQAGAARDGAHPVESDPADEVTALRGCYERWVEEHGGRTMVGLSGVPQRRFRGLVRFMQAFAAGGDPTYERVPAGMEVGRFLRLAADDVKAFYFEARFSQRPDQRHNDLQRWFWSETAMGGLLAAIAARLTERGDERSAQGIAR